MLPESDPSFLSLGAVRCAMAITHQLREKKCGEMEWSIKMQLEGVI